MADWKLRAKAFAFCLTALAALGGAQGCADERDPINRVQTNAIPKSLFLEKDGDGRYLDKSESWYFRATITDVPTSQATGFVGAAGDMYRVKWKISPDGRELQAYREDPDILGSGEQHGGIVAAFPISKHFDIRRAYNSGTGEEQNIIEENDVDRTWDKREYMRVDWGTNKISQAMFVAPGFEQFSGSTTWVESKDDANHPIFDKGYVNLTAQYTVSPDIYTCFYYYRDVGCGPGDVKARLSFMKVPERDFEPREYPDRIPLLDNDGNPIRTVSGNAVSLPMMDQFGFFRTERAQYDQRYGTLEKRYLYRANTWNLWDQWWARKENGEIQKFENGDKVPLKFKERKLRPIVYFLNPEFPRELRGVAQETADGWNDAFSETVAALRLLEDREPGSALGNEELRREVDAMKARGERPYILCQNNPVLPGDPSACGAPGTIARQGDSRYSFMYWVPKPQPSGPLGFGPSYADPITGQIFTASAYIYGAALDTYAQTATDIVNLLNGKFNEFDYANGIATDEYIKRLKAGDVPSPRQSAVGGLEQTTPGESAFDLGKAQGRVDSMVNRPHLKAIAKKGMPLATGPSSSDRLKQIFQNPQLAAKILENPETRLLAGFNADKSIADELRSQKRDAGETDKALHTIADALFAQDMVKKENERLTFLGKHGCYMDASMFDDSVVGLAREMAKKYPPSGSSAKEQEKVQHEIWNEMRRHVLRGVLEHEVGHTVGLRHNFEGSSDAINFFDEFWDLKKETLSFGAPMTENQKNGRMSEYQYTTVMDYGSRFNTDIHSLGKYDYAAIRFGYGNLVESFPKGKIKDPLYTARPDQFGQAMFTGYSAEYLDQVNRSYRHYTQIPGEFDGGVDAIKKRGREIRPFGDVVEHARAQYLKSKGSTALVKTGNRPGSGDNIDVVPYRYCGDEFAGAADRPLCERWDQGMDSFEVVNDAITRYQQYYVFDAFMRGRANGFNQFRGYLGKLMTRYFSHVHRQYIHWLFFQGSYDYYWSQIFGGEDGVKRGFIGNADWFKDPSGGLPETLATTWGIDRLIDVLATPDVGVYVQNQDHPLYPDKFFFEQVTSSPYACRDDFGQPQKCGSNEAQLSLDIDQGARYRFTRYDGSSGQGFFNRLKNVGSFYDKIAALLTLTSSDTNFVGQDMTNAVSYRIGFYLAYPRALSSVFGGVATDRFDQYAWRYEYAKNPMPSLPGEVKIMTRSVVQALGGGDSKPETVAAPLKGSAIDSGWYFFYKAYALFFSMAEFQSNFSQSWNDAVRVWCTGCGEAFTPIPGTTPIVMNDPLSGKQYGALDYGDGRYSPGADFIKEGQQLVKAYQDHLASPPDAADREYYISRARARVQDHVELMDLIRGLYQVYGYTAF